MRLKMIQKIGIIGGGSWGTAISSVLTTNAKNVQIWDRNKELVNDINNLHINTKYFAGFILDNKITATSDIFKVIQDADILVLAVPSTIIKEILEQIKDKINQKTIIVNLAKGFDFKSGKTLSYLIEETLKPNFKEQIVTLVGPSFASEVMERQFTTVCVTSTNLACAKKVQQTFSTDYFRVYTNEDVVGTECCAALKNVIAIACGIVEGVGLKNNSRAGVITRGMNEIRRFVKFYGGKEATCLGLAGYGDLILTCTSNTSRNYSAGVAIGKYGYDAFLKNNKKTVEGLTACKIVHKIAETNKIYAPIIDAVYNIITFNSEPIDEIKRLMRNELKNE